MAVAIMPPGASRVKLGAEAISAASLATGMNDLNRTTVGTCPRKRSQGLF
jgi:hypothetical protein